MIIFCIAMGLQIDISRYASDFNKKEEIWQMRKYFPTNVVSHDLLISKNELYMYHIPSMIEVP